MGGLGDAFKRMLVGKLGEQWWELNLNLVDQVWTAIETALAGLNLRYDRCASTRTACRFAAMSFGS